MPDVVGWPIGRSGQRKIDRCLGSGDAVAIDVKLVRLGESAEDRVIVEEQALAPRFALMKLVQRTNPCEAAPNDHGIVKLLGVDDVERLTPVGPVAKSVGCARHISGIAVGATVVADATISRPVRPQCLRGRRAGADKQCSARARKRCANEIASRDACTQVDACVIRILHLHGCVFRRTSGSKAKLLCRPPWERRLRPVAPRRDAH